MLLDNLFDLVGAPGTTMILFGILAFVGVAPARAVLLPGCAALDRRHTRRI